MICSNILRVECALKQLNLESAFKRIKYTAEINAEADIRKKEQAVRHTVKVVDKLLMRRYLDAINLTRHSGITER